MSGNSGVGTATKLKHEELTEQIIGAAIEVHKALGPGLLEGVYEGCLCHELKSEIWHLSARCLFRLFIKVSHSTADIVLT